MRPFERMAGRMPASSTVTVAILFFINLINYMDRFTIAGVLSKVQSYYDFDSKRGGLLQTAFVVSYMAMAPLFGYLGDRHSRRYIMAGGVLFWSITTFVGSLIPAEMPALFFLTRALVGVGEASYSTIAPTLIADLFVNEMRTRMLGVFFFAIPVGSGLGFIVGSQMASLFGDWKYALRVTPPLGIISVVMIIFILKEPTRGQSEGVVQSEDTTPVLEEVRYLTSNKSYIWSTMGFTCVSFAIGALSWWAPNYMELASNVAKNNVSKDTIDLIFGSITALAGILGVVIGSGGAQIYRRYTARADPILCAIGVFVSVPFGFVGLALPHRALALSWILIFVAIVALCINWTLVADILLYVVPANRRSFAQAIQILIAHLLGDAFSPFLVGFLDDAWRPANPSDEDSFYSLQYALYSLFVLLVLGGLCFLYTARYIISDRNAAKMQMHSGEQIDQDTSIHSLPAGDFGIVDESLQSFPPLGSDSFDSDLNQLVTRD